MNLSKILSSFFLTLIILGSGFLPSFATIEPTQNQPTDLKKSCNCVAFRFDDVQNYWLNNVQMAVIETFYQRQIPLTIGVIGENFGEDSILSGKITNLMNEEFELDVANHGWQHEDFSNFSKYEQSDLLKLTNQSIQESLGITPIVFIPPLNSFNNDTLNAMEENGLRYFSTELDESEIIYQYENSSTFHFPEGATTGILDKEKYQFQGLSSTATFADIQASIDVHGFGVVTLHPQEFSIIENGVYTNKINQDQFNQLNLLFDKIQENEFEIVLISEIDEKSSLIPFEKEKIPFWVKSFSKLWAKGEISDEQYSRGIYHLIKINKIQYSDLESSEDDIELHIPNWIKNNAQWWSDDLVSEKEFVNGLQYLVSNQIIKI